MPFPTCSTATPTGVIDLTWGHPDPSTFAARRDRRGRPRRARPSRLAGVVVRSTRRRGGRQERRRRPSHRRRRRRVAARRADHRREHGRARSGAVAPRRSRRRGLRRAADLFHRPADLRRPRPPGGRAAPAMPTGPIRTSSLARAAADHGGGVEARSCTWCRRTRTRPGGACLDNEPKRCSPPRRPAAPPWSKTTCTATHRRTAPASMWSIDPSAVIRLGSFSKSLAPGLRVGYLTATPELVDRIAGCGVLDSGGGANHFAAMVVGELIRSGRFGEIVHANDPRHRACRAALVDALDPSVFSFDEPDGRLLRLAAPARRCGVGIRSWPPRETTGCSCRTGVCSSPANPTPATSASRSACSTRRCSATGATRLVRTARAAHLTGSVTSASGPAR